MEEKTLNKAYELKESIIKDERYLNLLKKRKRNGRR